MPPLPAGFSVSVSFRAEVFCLAFPEALCSLSLSGLWQATSLRPTARPPSSNTSEEWKCLPGKGEDSMHVLARESSAPVVVDDGAYRSIRILPQQEGLALLDKPFRVLHVRTAPRGDPAQCGSRPTESTVPRPCSSSTPDSKVPRCCVPALMLTGSANDMNHSLLFVNLGVFGGWFGRDGGCQDGYVSCGTPPHSLSPCPIPNLQLWSSHAQQTLSLERHQKLHARPQGFEGSHLRYVG
ncbi:hypothetical protein QBC39DRAFT_340402 [Podospora conica]|nr:hypothetical protein QBC39DRAFT_340402 [Schizothecium conicum]